jgi:hypothetical protein
MKKLLVFVSGLNGLEQEWEAFRDRLISEESLEGSDTLIFTHYGFRDIDSVGKIFNKSARDISLVLKARIENKCISMGSDIYDEIICIGHRGIA